MSNIVNKVPLFSSNNPQNEHLIEVQAPQAPTTYGCHFGFVDPYRRNPKLVALDTQLSNVRKNGYIRLVLNNGFLQDRWEFMNSVINSATKLDNTNGYLQGEIPKDEGWPFSLDPERYAYWNEAVAYWQGNTPNPPYEPKIGSLTLDYSSSETVAIPLTPNKINNEVDRAAAINTLAAKHRNQIEKRFHLYPFGQAEILPVSNFEQEEAATQVAIDQALPEITLSTALVPDLTLHNFTERTLSDGAIAAKDPAGGELLIGLKDVSLPQVLTILFQFEEGSGNSSLAVPELRWSYLQHNKWHTFPDGGVNYDDTLNFVQAGVVSLNLPRIALGSNTLLDPELLWIKATAIESSATDELVEAVDRLLSVRTQGVTLTFQDNNNAASYLKSPMPAETLEAFANSDFEITASIQEKPSFGGREKEAGQSYYTRVSERLRHKQRAITPWDVERLVLQNFPYVDKVRCFSHVNSAGIYEPTRYLATVIPDPASGTFGNKFQPKLSLTKLQVIELFLEKLSSSTATVAVRNPTYEPVVVSIDVALRAGYDQQLYKNELNKDLQRYISPYAFGEAEQVLFETTLNESSILAYVERLEYIDAVLSVSLSRSQASRPGAVLVSDLQHTITITDQSC